MKDIVLIGAGGLAREVAWLLEENNRIRAEWNLMGYISKEEPGTPIGKQTVLGDDSWLIKHNYSINAVCCIGDSVLRKKIVEKLQVNSKIIFPNIIANGITVSESVHMGKGCIITASSVLTIDIEIGDFFLCNLGSTVGHDCRIGDYVTLNPGSHISGGVTLEDGVSIGTGASVIQGIKIGRNTVIGAGATVIEDFPNDCVGVGVPARPLFKR